MIDVGDLKINKEGRETTVKWTDVNDQEENTRGKWATWLGGTKSFATRGAEGLKVGTAASVLLRKCHTMWKNGERLGDGSRGGENFRSQLRKGIRSVLKRELRALGSLRTRMIGCYQLTYQPPTPKGFSPHLTMTDGSLSQTQSLLPYLQVFPSTKGGVSKWPRLLHLIKH